MKLKTLNKFGNLLTSNGLQQTFERAEYILKRYQTLLNNTDIHSISTKSSFTSRAKLSALSQLLGMFGSTECKNEMILFTSVNHTLELETLDDLSQKLREGLSEFVPYVNADEQPTTTFNMGYINGTLYSKVSKDYTQEELLILSQLKHNITDWTNENYPIVLDEIYHFGQMIRSIQDHELKLNSKFSQSGSNLFGLGKSLVYEKERHDSASNQLVSLLNGNELLKHILNAVELAAKQFESNLEIAPVYYFTSGHDINIIAIMNHLGNKEKIVFSFGSSLFFELHEDDTTHKLFMKIFIDDTQLPIHQNSLYLSIGEEDQIKSLPKSTFVPLVPANEADNKSCSLNYFRKLIKSRTFEENTDDLCNKEIEEIIAINKHKIESQDSSKVFILKTKYATSNKDNKISF